MTTREKLFRVSALVALFTAVAGGAYAQRSVNWQVNSKGFPAQTSVFVDVEDAGAYKRDLPAGSFGITLDEFAEDQGGIVVNGALQGAQGTMGGWTGSQVLVLIDISRSYTKEFELARQMAKHLIAQMDPTRDEVAIATYPTEGGYTESKLQQGFTGSVETLNAAVDSIALFSDDKTGGRICNALSEALAFFPGTNTDKYRTVMLITGGADKGEGKGSCVQDSQSQGRVPFWAMGFKLDKKYDDPRNAHKIENGLHDLAQNTGGLSMFRKPRSNYESFAGQAFWNRVRSQYRLVVSFMCYAPAPEINHIAVLKVDGQSATPIKFQAAAAPTPIPAITAIYPGEATRKQVDDGLELTVDGTGFCGAPGQIRVTVEDRQAMTKTAAPYRLVAALNSTIEEGTVKVTNKWTQTGQSTVPFKIAKPPKGAEANQAFVILVVVLVVVVILAILLIALRSRKAVVPKGAAPVPASPSTAVPSTGGSSATVAISQMPLARVWVVGPAEQRRQLQVGRNLIGREPNCQIQLSVEGVSREHAAIFVNDASNRVEVEDLRSTNGTLVGAAGAEPVRITERRVLKPGEQIHIGGNKLTVMFESGEA